MDKKCVIEVLTALGIDSDLLGFKCLYEMINIYQLKGESINADVFYQILVMKLQKNKTQIDRAIRYAFYQMIENETPLYEELFKGEPGILDFVIVVSQYVKQNK